MRSIRNLFLLICVVFVSMPILAFGAGTCTISDANPSITAGGWKEYNWTCTSDGAGAVSFSSSATARITGIIYFLEITPGTGVSAGTVKLVSEAGSAQDYFFGVGASFCTSAGTACMRTPVNDDGGLSTVLGKSLAPEISGMGATKTVVVTIRVKEK